MGAGTAQGCSAYNSDPDALQCSCNGVSAPCPTADRLLRGRWEQGKWTEPISSLSGGSWPGMLFGRKWLLEFHFLGILEGQQATTMVSSVITKVTYKGDKNLHQIFTIKKKTSYSKRHIPKNDGISMK